MLSLVGNRSYQIQDYRLEAAKDVQAEAIVKLVNASYGGFFSRFLEDRPENTRIDLKGVQDLIHHKSLKLYVLVNKTHKVVGTVVYNPNGEKKSAWFGLFSLDPTLRGNGVGSKMIKIMESIARENRKIKMKLDVSGFAKALQGNYERNGYAKNGKKIPFEKGIHWTLKPEYKHHPDKDFVIMSKILESIH